MYVSRFESWRQSVENLLAKADLAGQLAGRNLILVKPNLVEALDPPITTPVFLVETLVACLAEIAPHAEIIVGEGCGSLDYDTFHSFEFLGYSEMAARMKVRLVDLNEAELVRNAKKECRRWPEMYLPKIAFDAYLISVPVLKAHSLAGVTLTMKNMMGLAPPSHYQRGGHWKKASFHDDMQEAVYDLNRYRTPDFTLLDATIGMQEAHLWGPTCDPPPNCLLAGYDPVAIDAYGAGLLKRDWRRIGHIRMADKELGIAEPLEVVVVE